MSGNGDLETIKGSQLFVGDILRHGNSREDRLKSGVLVAELNDLVIPELIGEGVVSLVVL